MDVREKLIELIAKAKYICANDYSDHTEDEYIADTLLDNGVTVQDGLQTGHRKCSRCGEIVKYGYSLYGVHNFCNYCGAKMNEEVEHER